MCHLYAELNVQQMCELGSAGGVDRIPSEARRFTDGEAEGRAIGLFNRSHNTPAADFLHRQRLKTTPVVLYAMSKQVNTVVSGDESEVHDEPHIRDRRITVNHIHALVEERGLDAQTVADRFDLTASEIYHALAYYHDHPEEMRAVEEHRRELHETAKEDPKIVTSPEDLPES